MAFPLHRVRRLNTNRVDKKRNHSLGFTLIEAIAVLIALGILGAFAVIKILPTQSYTVASEKEILKMHLRYVQLRAFGDDKTWGMSFAGDTYTALRDGNIADYNLPNENSPTHTLPSGITISGETVTFDEWGSPGNSNIQLNMSAGGGDIIITKNTGFIQ